MSVDWRKYLAQMAFTLALLGAVLLIISLSGCASVGEARSDQAKIGHEVSVTKKQVLVPATESTPEHIVVISETVERWLDEKTKTETHSEDHHAPDLPAVGTGVSAVSGLIPGGTGIGGLIGLAAGAFAAWKAASGTVKTLKDQVEYHRKDADEAWQKADERALKLPPT